MMRIYLLKISDSIFEYQYLTNNINLQEINKLLQLSNLDLPILNNSDSNILKSGGGSIIYIQPNPEYYIYLIDLDFILDRNQYKVYDKPLYDKFDHFRINIKRDIKLNNIIKNEQNI